LIPSEIGRGDPDVGTAYLAWIISDSNHGGNGELEKRKRSSCASGGNFNSEWVRTAPDEKNDVMLSTVTVTGL
jgi:hypothetical protein